MQTIFPLGYVMGSIASRWREFLIVVEQVIGEDDVMGRQEERLERLVVLVQVPLGREGEPLADPLDKPRRRPGLLQVAEPLVVEAERAGQLVEPEVEVGHGGKVLTKRQDLRGSVVVPEDGDQAFAVLDRMRADLTEFNVDFEHD